MIKGQGVIWSRRRKNVGADTWTKLDISYETILKGFPKKEKKVNVPHNELDRYATIRYERCWLRHVVSTNVKDMNYLRRALA